MPHKDLVMSVGPQLLHDHKMDDLQTDLHSQPAVRVEPSRMGASSREQSSASLQVPNHSRYTDQFSTASSKAILRRLSAQIDSTSPAPKSLANRMMSLPPRKDATADEESSMMAPPVCSVCNRPVRSALNPLVPCARCGRTWHRLCHDPAIAEHVAAAAAISQVTIGQKSSELSAKGMSMLVTVPNAPNGAVTDGMLKMPSPTIDSDSKTALNSFSAWSCPPCSAFATAAAAKRLAHYTRTHIQPENTLFIPPPPALKTHDVTKHTPKDLRRYLSGLSQRELTQWLAYALETHADLAVYTPTVESSSSISTAIARLPSFSSSGGRRRLTAAEVVAAARNPAYRSRIISAIRKLHAASVAKRTERKRETDRLATERLGLMSARRGRPPKQPVVAAHEKNSSIGFVHGTKNSHHIPSFVPTSLDPEEEDPTGLMVNWPKPGNGLYMNVTADWDMDEDEETGGDTLSGAVLVDNSDHATFSSVVYNAVGQKVQENGLPVLRVR